MEKKKQTMVSVAKLDEDGLYLGVESIPQSALTDQHVQIPADCDLVPRAYGWHASQKTFLPTKKFIFEQRAAKRPRGRV